MSGQDFRVEVVSVAFVPITDENTQLFFHSRHLDVVVFAPCFALAVPKRPFGEPVEHGLTNVLMIGTASKIGQFFWVVCQVEQNRRIAGCMNVFPFLGDDHERLHYSGGESVAVFHRIYTWFDTAILALT